MLSKEKIEKQTDYGYICMYPEYLPNFMKTFCKSELLAWKNRLATHEYKFIYKQNVRCEWDLFHEAISEKYRSKKYA